MKSAVIFPASKPHRHRRKRCPACGVVYDLRARYFTYATDPETGKRLWKSCRRCDRKRQAAMRARAKADPERAARRREQHREWQRAARVRDPQKSREAVRRWRARLKEEDPDRYVELLIIPRRFRAGENRNLSRATRTKYDRYRKPSHVEAVPPEPLVAWICARFDGWQSHEIAAIAGDAVSERWLFKLLHGNPASLELDAVDRFLTLGFGRPDLLNDLYPIAV